MGEFLTDRQRREVEFHRGRAHEHESLANAPVSMDVVTSERRRWWNSYWHTYTILRNLPLAAKVSLVVGCGFGEDAIRLSYLTNHVYALDISRESLEIAKERAERDARCPIKFCEAPAERMPYPDHFFDLILVHDILHHCDIPATVKEIRRVAANGAYIVGSDPYTHSYIQQVRNLPFIDKYLHPRMARFIYGRDEPYITDDERKIDEKDLSILRDIVEIENEDYFRCVTGRLLPDITSIAKIERLFLMSNRWAGRLLGGKVVYAGRLTQ